MKQIKKDHIYTVNEIVALGLYNVKHRFSTANNKDIQKQLLLRHIRKGNLLATKYGAGVYFIKGYDLINFLKKYDKQTDPNTN
jgi:hypothetical protein